MRRKDVEVYVPVGASMTQLLRSWDESIRSTSLLLNVLGVSEIVDGGEVWGSRELSIECYEAGAIIKDMVVGFSGVPMYTMKIYEGDGFVEITDLIRYNALHVARTKVLLMAFANAWAWGFRVRELMEHIDGTSAQSANATLQKLLSLGNISAKMVAGAELVIQGSPSSIRPFGDPSVFSPN